MWPPQKGVLYRCVPEEIYPPLGLFVFVVISYKNNALSRIKLMIILYFTEKHKKNASGYCRFENKSYLCSAFEKQSS